MHRGLVSEYFCEHFVNIQKDCNIWHLYLCQIKNPSRKNIVVGTHILQFIVIFFKVYYLQKLECAVLILNQ
jgi:hypothetical protein